MEFAKSYNVTKYFNNLAKRELLIGVGKIYEHGYFVSMDVLDFIIYRIQVGINAEYEEEERTKIAETDKISKDDFFEFVKDNNIIEKSLLDNIIFQNENYQTRSIVKEIIDILGLEKTILCLIAIDGNKGFENYDVDEYRYDTPLEEIIDAIEGQYGTGIFENEDISEELIPFFKKLY